MMRHANAGRLGCWQSRFCRSLALAVHIATASVSVADLITQWLADTLP